MNPKEILIIYDKDHAQVRLSADDLLSVKPNSKKGKALRDLIWNDAGNSTGLYKRISSGECYNLFQLI